METKEAYKKKLKAQLAEWQAQINLLAAKTENKAADVSIKYARELDELRSKQRKLSDKVKELEQASGDAWQDIKGNTDQLWNDLKTGIASAISKFK